MTVLIVESDCALAAVWQAHLERLGMEVAVCTTQDNATSYLATHDVDIIILDLLLTDGSAFAIADYASYRVPETQVIFVTTTSFFSDGSIFSFAANACALVRRSTPVDDLAAMVEHFSPN